MSGISIKEKKLISGILLIGSVVILLMMFVGLLMLLAQGEMISIKEDFFYELLTVHGTGMVGVGAFAASAVMWYFLRQYVKLTYGVLLTYFVLVLIGVALVLVSIFGFDFAAGWTFLYPLPAMGASVWGITGAAMYFIGMLIIGVAFLLFYLDTARGIIQTYGSLGKALGWKQLFGKDDGNGPPPAVVASTMVTIVNITALIAGASILVMSLINLLVPSYEVDPLLAKNLIYAFGHIFANSIIYMGVIAVYELLPRYTGRPWKGYKIFYLAWNLSTLFTIIIYPHHLLMDFAMPKWMLIMGQALSYMNGLPALVVTAFGALMIIYNSGIKWDMASSFMILSMFGWVVGVIPAIIDATIAINHVMHNTKWVPGHFHMYMGIGAVSMIFGFMYYLARENRDFEAGAVEQISFWVYIVFFLGLTGSFLFSGKVSAPRRWAVHMPEWVPYDRLGAIFAIAIIFAVIVFIGRFVVSMRSISVKKDIGTGPYA
jgi:cytochrome c oxidase subunit I